MNVEADATLVLLEDPETQKKTPRLNLYQSELPQELQRWRSELTQNVGSIEVILRPKSQQTEEAGIEDASDAAAGI